MAVNAYVDVTVTAEAHTLLSSHLAIRSPSMNRTLRSTYWDEDVMLGTNIEARLEVP